MLELIKKFAAYSIAPIVKPSRYSYFGSYDAERIANGLARVTSYHDWDQPILEAYFPKLTTANGAIHWASRPSGLLLKVH